MTMCSVRKRNDGDVHVILCSQAALHLHLFRLELCEIPMVMNPTCCHSLLRQADNKMKFLIAYTNLSHNILSS